jgi:hypothetical protein
MGGAQRMHALELRQHYENVATDGAQDLLNNLSRLGTVTSTGPSRWQVETYDTWIRLSWDQTARSLVVSISDKRPRPVDQLPATQQRYEEVLAQRVTPLLVSLRAAAVGSFVEPRQHTATGLSLFHTTGDRADAVKQMVIDVDALYQALASQVGEVTVDPKSPSGFHITTQKEWDAHPPDPKKVTWWKSYALPIFKQWAKFKQEQLGGDRTFADSYIAFGERFTTNWDTYENWKKKLDNLRDEAQKRGFSVDLPKPAGLPTTVWADAGSALSQGASAVATGIGDIWPILKYGVWAVLGIGTIVAISSVATDLRSGKDPGEKYRQLIRDAQARPGRPPPRAPRALPTAREQLALPLGEPAGAV